MRIIVTCGVVLGLLVACWTIVMGATGWYADPILRSLFWAVVVIEIAVLVLALRAKRKRWLAQVGTGTLVALVACPIVFAGSVLFTTVLFPDYFATLRAMQESMLRAQGMDEARVRAEIAATAAMQTPFAQAAAGAVGTFVTGVVASAVIGAFVRDRERS